MLLPAQFILDAFRKVFRAIRLNSNRIEKRLGISSAQLFVLQKLIPNEWVSINEIAARTHTDQSSVSVVVRKLIEEKFLLKKTNPGDRRSVLVSLSLLGIKYHKHSNPLIQNQLMKGVASLSPPEQAELARLLGKFLQGADLHDEEAALFFEKGKHHVGKRKKILSTPA